MTDDRAVVDGDARLALALAAEQERRFDLLVIDAFTSDAIPIHLLTLEALTLYRNRLANGGVLMIHISNRHLELTRALAPIVERLGLSAVIQGHAPSQNHPDAAVGPSEFHFPSNGVAVARNPEAPAPIARDPRWKRLSPKGEPVLWTDDYSNILSTLR